MIEGIYQIGRLAKEGKGISEILSDIPNLKEDVKYKIGKINYDLEEGKVKIDLIEEYEPGKEERYKFIQMRLTGRQNQFFATFTDEKRFLGEKGKKYALWISMEDELKELDQTEEIKEMIENLRRIEKEFYKDYVLDLSKVEGFEGSDFKKWIKSKLGRGEDIAFWTVEVNGKLVVDMDFYEELIRKKSFGRKEKKRKGNLFNLQHSGRLLL